ncbi:CobW family GTP-binding protein [Acinetobacter sp. Ver3]|uniref:CobW family GTP-binding protein n=1 Tax=Acinetobacter sp. Ver3 TaxID=466088 RepID=UPI00044F52D4|nr:GTP-binding protein [Acinetobacter sp. Ver3]EZQ02388.1 cobalamin biosynthesis protein [Acinetobacter sp. Ver3]
MKVLATQSVPTHIITGFLGAGKTTLLQQLLKFKPKNERWAVLMNEFGQIGVDQQLLPNNDGYEIKELLGGCLCCTSQLPMQIALSRLLQESHPDRLFIEPTGLGHPAQLVEQLTEPHWQHLVEMRSVVTVIDGSRLHDPDWMKQSLYQDQLKAAQVVVVSHASDMNDMDRKQLADLKQQYLAYIQHWLEADQGNIRLEQIDYPYVGIQRSMKPLFKVQRQFKADEEMPAVKQLPYHYVEQAQGYIVAGWKLPKRWQFDFYELLDILCELKHWVRIKGIFNTNQGWMTFNFNPDQFNYKSGEENVDNRIEVITQQNQDWEHLEQSILKARIDDQ